ncbi:MAG: hypothetical protein DRP89_09260 [Candidatus Neomarinimicrobiota bacterium]|nr:MAG: hypothetical protein DRP89_09260 [Candidatus Neomarinimicrobiota bacterium]
MISCIFLSILVNSCSNGYYEKRITETPRPHWVDNPRAGIYIGVSHKFPAEADARADAINDAKRQIIESLGGIIESEFVDKIVESSGKISTTDAFTSSRVKVISRNIIAVKPENIFVEKWRKQSGRHSTTLYQVYVAVPFSEIKHKKFMKELVNETYNLGDKRYKESMDLAFKGRIFLAINQLKTIKDNISPLSNITGLSPSDLKEINSLKENIKATIDEMQSGILIEGKGDHQPAKLGNPLANPLKLSVFWQKGTERFPIPGLQVDFKLIKGKAVFTPTSHTNKEGNALCEVREISSAGKIEIEADVHFPEGYDIKQNKFIYHLLSENKVIVKIIETNLGKPVGISYLENTLLQKLTDKGFTAIENDIFSKISKNLIEKAEPEYIAELVKNSDADLVLLGTVSSGQLNKIQEGFYFARARGVIRVFNIEKQKVVGNYIVEDKEAGNSEENAGTKAISKVSDQLVQKLLSEMGLR